MCFLSYSSSVVDLEIRLGDTSRSSFIMQNWFSYPGFLFLHMKLTIVLYQLYFLLAQLDILFCDDHRLGENALEYLLSKCFQDSNSIVAELSMPPKCGNLNLKW